MLRRCWCWEGNTHTETILTKQSRVLWVWTNKKSARNNRRVWAHTAYAEEGGQWCETQSDWPNLTHHNHSHTHVHVRTWILFCARTFQRLFSYLELILTDRAREVFRPLGSLDWHDDEEDDYLGSLFSILDGDNFTHVFLRGSVFLEYQTYPGHQDFGIEDWGFRVQGCLLSWTPGFSGFSFEFDANSGWWGQRGLTVTSL